MNYFFSVVMVVVIGCILGQLLYCLIFKLLHIKVKKDLIFYEDSETLDQNDKDFIYIAEHFRENKLSNADETEKQPYNDKNA
ncbi:MAG: hypothetical protein RSD63_06380 [Eubacterium sp.]